MLIWLLHLWTPAGSASFGLTRHKDPTRIHPTESCVTTNEFNLSSYRDWILESIIPTRGITTAMSFQGKMSCTRRIKSWNPKSWESLFLFDSKINQQHWNMSERDSFINTNCHSWVTELSYQPIHTIKRSRSPTTWLDLTWPLKFSHPPGHPPIHDFLPCLLELQLGSIVCYTINRSIPNIYGAIAENNCAINIDWY